MFCLGLDHLPDPVQKQFSPHGGEGGKWGGGDGGTGEERVQGGGTWSTLRSAGEGCSAGGGAWLLRLPPAGASKLGTLLQTVFLEIWEVLSRRKQVVWLGGIREEGVWIQEKKK